MGKMRVFLVEPKRTISKENTREWLNEKRAKELASGRHNGIRYTPGNIEAMTGIPARKIEKMIKHRVHKDEMRPDGKLDK